MNSWLQSTRRTSAVGNRHDPVGRRGHLPLGRRKARLFYAEKATPGISRRGAARTLCEVGADPLLRGPPAIRQEGPHAILADEPEYTTGLREHLSRREHRWAPAIKHLVEAVYL